MDALSIVGMVVGAFSGAGGVFAFGVSVGREKGVKADLEALSGRLHKLSSWKDGLPKELREEYVPRRELALELQPIKESLGRIEASLEART